ncbi:MAG: peptidoglycan DD-metalloendopeptidase family protein [Candidatus Thiodiazotropha sp.]|nr:MAG: peptidase M23 [gamma proteobacterium symbiont of Ctena orbiculata]PUB76933.1 MAG: peptidase M23 [gamma proteobacterium symbiont of Ctena orbiculata]
MALCVYLVIGFIKQTMKSALFVLLIICFVNSYAESTVYKYKDHSGNTVFTDNRPEDVEPEKVTLKSKEKEKKQPRFYVEENSGNYHLQVENPLYAPIQITVSFNETHPAVHDLVGPDEIRTLATFSHNDFKYRYRWVLGDPGSTPTESMYSFPVIKSGKYRISQGFKGGFSHSKEPNLYALDIALPIGTDLVAAREGVVISVKDDYHMSGKNDYFLDKANYVKILHADGTYATYAHILMGSASVEPGEVVSEGQKIARSGSSGYSRGPHVHFVVRKNSGMKTRSLPFVMLDKAKQKIVLEKGAIVKM